MTRLSSRFLELPVSGQFEKELVDASRTRHRALESGATGASPGLHSSSQRPNPATAVMMPLLTKRLDLSILAPKTRKES